MSWTTGYFGEHLPPAIRSRLKAQGDQEVVRADAGGSFIRAGGLAATCLHGILPDGRRWLVVGLGLQTGEAGFHVLDAAAWSDLASQAQPEMDRLDGHFVLLRWSQRRFEAFVDQACTRTLYFRPFAEGLLFSTRLDHLARVLGGLEIDYAVFGAQWITFNQLSSQSPVQGLMRLGPAGRASFSRGRLEVSERAWAPQTDRTDRTGHSFARRVRALLRPVDGRRLSLGLSGGLDSRLLLALGPAGMSTHVFGPPDHPDARIANSIAAKEGLRHVHLDLPDPEMDQCLEEVYEAAGTTHAIAPASSTASRNLASRLHAAGLAMVDGALGEAARRQFMNRLLWQGRGSRRPPTILKRLRVQRMSCFSRGVQKLMESGTLGQIDALWSGLPGGLGREDSLDLAGVRSRLPNFFGLEQQRLDGLLVCFMPFAQPSVLRSIFRLPLQLRRSGRLFRTLVRSGKPSLARHPLVKDGISYPYHLAGPGAFLFTRAKKKLGYRHKDATQLAFLHILKPFVLDTLHSQSVKSYAPYDVPAIAAAVEGYYKGKIGLAGSVDWWLSFEIWRQSLSASGSILR